MLRKGAEDQQRTRREFLMGTTAIACAAGVLRAAEGLAADAPVGEMPKIKLGRLEVSRLILGSNPFFGFNHGNPQATAKEMKEWYTPQQVMAVLNQAAEHGVTAVWSPPYDHWLEVWSKYRQRGGKLKTWIGQPDDFANMKEQIAKCAKNGAGAVCIQGECAGRAIREKKYALVKEWLEHVKSFKLPAGMASHYPEALLKAEELGLPAEWYHLTIGIPDSFKPRDREQSLQTIAKLKKPVVAFKILGAGRFKPKDAFPEVLGKLRRTDGMCVGVFPKQRDEISELSSLTLKLTKKTPSA